MSVYSLSVCSCFNCALGFTLASQLARFHRPSYQALLCVMNAVGNQFASISILTCRQFVGEDYIAFVAFAVAIVAVAIAACTLFRMSQLGLPIDKLDSRTSSTSEAV